MPRGSQMGKHEEDWFAASCGLRAGGPSATAICAVNPSTSLCYAVSE